jgi:hypothetical protein
VLGPKNGDWDTNSYILSGLKGNIKWVIRAWGVVSMVLSIEGASPIYETVNAVVWV